MATLKAFSNIRTSVLGLGVAAIAVSTMPLLAPVSAQNANPQNAGPPPVPAAAPNAFGLPENVTILGNANPNERSATALVNGYVITGTDIAQRVALVTNASENEISAEELERLRAQVLRNLIDETIKIQAAEAQEIGAEKAQVEQTYAQLAAQNFGDDPEGMDNYLVSIGSSPRALKRQIQGELAWDNLVRRNVSPFVNVAAEEVTGVLERLEASRGTEEYRLGEIYMSATDENREAVLANMGRILEQLQQGGSFVAYARQFSEASTAVTGGDTDFLRIATLPAPMAEAVVGMQPGQLVGPIAIPGGYTIIYLIDKRQVLTADPRDAVLSLKQISIQLAPGATQEQANAQIETFSAAVQSMSGCSNADEIANGIGATVVTNPELQVRQLPDQLQGILLDLQVGQATPPFGTPEDGVRVLMLCGRDDPKQAGAPSFQSVMNSMEEERINKRAQRYLRDLRNDAYIQYN